MPGNALRRTFGVTGSGTPWVPLGLQPFAGGCSAPRLLQPGLMVKYQRSIPGEGAPNCLF